MLAINTLDINIDTPMILSAKRCADGNGTLTYLFFSEEHVDIARAKAIGFAITPAYVLQGIALFGHPGPQALARMIEAAKECDALICK
jgi:hypothetical protein